MITKDFAKLQIARMQGLDGFPRNPESLAELVIAMEISETEEQARLVGSDILREFTRCPKPAEIRRAINALNEGQWEPRQNQCPDCGGTQFVISWWLVTYSGRRGLTKPISKERLSGEEAAETLRKLIKDNQDVLSAARPCICHAPPRESTKVLATGKRQA